MCQMQTSFWSCGQLGEGKTILCFTYQLTQGKCCDGYSSFSRMIHIACPNCLAGKPHPQSQDLNASIAVKGGVVQDFVPNPVPVSEANALPALPDTCNPVDLLNVVNSTTMAPPLKDSISRVKQQHRGARARKPPPRSVPTPARLSAKGGIQKPAPPSAGRRSLRRLSPIAETVASMSSSPRRSPRTKNSHSPKRTEYGGSLDVIGLSPSSIQNLDFSFDPALIGLD